MNHHHCCCEGTEVFLDGSDISCIQLQLGDFQGTSCEVDQGAEFGVCAGKPNKTLRRVFGSPTGLGQMMKLGITSTPITPPYGVYTYGFSSSDTADHKPIDWAVELYTRDHFEDTIPAPTVCVEGRNYTRVRASKINSVLVGIDYQPGVDPVVVSVIVGLAGHEDKLFQTISPRPSEGTTTTTDTTNPVNPWGFDNPFKSPTGPFAIGVAIANEDKINTFCSFGGMDVGGFIGSATVTLDPDDTCLEALRIYKAVACGDSGVLPSVIYVDLGTRSDADLAAGDLMPFSGGQGYVLTDEHFPGETPTAVVWSNAKCYPLVHLCGDPSTVGGYNPHDRPAGMQTLVDGSSDRWIPTTGSSSTIDVVGTWENTPCPGGLLMAPPTNEIQSYSSSNRSGLRKTGLVSEAELDAMGGSPEQEAAKLKQGGCCDPPRAID